jgi:hypothetical protein
MEETTMRAEEFAELVRQRPFKGLRVHLTDGTVHEIRHPDSVLVLRQRVDIGVKSDPATGVIERVEHCSLLHIVGVEELSGSLPSAESNGMGH